MTSAIGLPMSSVSSTASCFGVLIDERGEAIEDVHALARRHARPDAALECALRGGDRAIDVFRRAGGHLGERLAGCRD